MKMREAPINNRRSVNLNVPVYFSFPNRIPQLILCARNKRLSLAIDKQGTSKSPSH